MSQIDSPQRGSYPVPDLRSLSGSSRPPSS